MERTHSHISFTLLNNTVSVALFNYGKQCILVPIVTVVNQLSNYGTCCYKSIHSTVKGEWCGYRGYSLWSYVDWFKFCIHLRSLNVRHFGMIEATGLKSMVSK
jgi:hypothetical protein